MRHATLLGFLIALVSTPLAPAALVLHEPFDYSTGDLNGNGSTSLGFTGNWSNDNRYDIDSGTVSYGSLSSTGNRMGLNNGGGGMHRIAAGVNIGASLLSDNSTLWFSFLVTTYQDASNDAFILALGTDPWNAGESAQPGQAVGFYMLNGGAARAQFWNTNSLVGSPSGSSDLVPNTWTGGESQTQLIVGRIDWGEDGVTNDLLRLYNVGTGLTLGTEFSSASFDATQGGFDTLAMTGRNGLILDVDEIRFGSDMADVMPVPEPESAILGAIGFALLLRRRR